VHALPVPTFSCATLRVLLFEHDPEQALQAPQVPHSQSLGAGVGAGVGGAGVGSGVEHTPFASLLNPAQQVGIPVHLYQV
jgi:hypothetical protein